MNRSLFIRYYACITIIISIIVLTFVQNVFIIADIHFYLLVMLVAMDAISERTVSLMSIWLSGFIYIILSDILLYCYGPEHSWAATFMLLSNDVVVLGYYLTKPSNKKRTIINDDLNKPTKYFAFFYIALFFVFLMYIVPQTIQAISLGGRNIERAETNLLLSTFLGGYKVMPIIIAAYYAWFNPRKKWLAVLISLPFLFADFFAGTRFRFLFSVLPFLLIIGYLNLREFNFRSVASILMIIIVVGAMSSLMLAARTTGYNSKVETKNNDLGNHPYGDYLSVRVCSHGSPEGTVSMMSLLKNHLATHNYTYGVSTGFILYFWVPRAIWPDKPTMVGHWLPHTYLTGFGEGHSASLGFTGEPYADFGYFSLLIFFFVGVMMRKGNNFIKQYDYGRAPCVQSLISVMLIPYVFFAVRSPVTATCYTLMEILILYLFYHLFFTKRKTQ